MMPTFIVIGAPRSGTTSMFHYLRQHPAVVMSFIKEINFFVYLTVQNLGIDARPNVPWTAKSLSEYQALFQPKAKCTAVGEASPMYFYVPGVPSQIKAVLPDVRLMCILRNPIQRAYSAYLKNTLEGFESRTFQDAVRDELENKSRIIQSQDYYVRIGKYHGHLLRFLECFDEGKLAVYFYDDLLESPRRLMRRLFEYLEVDRGFVPDTSVRFNPGGLPLIRSNPKMHAWKPIVLRLRRLLPLSIDMLFYRMQLAMIRKTLRVPEMPRDIALRLRDFYADDVLGLERLTNRSLAHWLQV